jgi:hypothetical protein
MPYWVIQGREAYTIREADHWLDALPDALQELGLDLPRVRVAANASGVIRLADPSGDIVALVRPGNANQRAADGALDHQPHAEDGLLAIFDEPLPTGEIGLPEGVADRLFEITAPIDEAETDALAADRALELLMGIVPCDAGSVLYAGLDHDHFAFLAARGPAADRVRNLQLPLGQGHVGAVHDSGVAVMLHDVAHSARHWHEIDHATGFHPRALVAVPIRSGDGRSWGVIELLSTDDRLFGWHVTATDTVAQTLAERFAASAP